MTTARGIPRILVAGISSGVGKTTVTVGLVRALRARGLRVAVFKCGPDYLDPTYHALAAGRPSHNLDGWMMGPDAVRDTFTRAAADADVAVLEGVMGLFDGASATGEEGSSAEIAKWLGASVLLVVDASGMARSVAAVAHGFRTFDPDLRVAGVIANRVGGRGHLDLLRRALVDPPILGGLPSSDATRFPERHLGLVTASAGGVDEIVLDRLGATVADWVDVDAVLDVARSAGPIHVGESVVRAPASARCRIGLAFDEAFHFYYEDNLARLEQLGATLVRFSPVRDAGLPEADALFFGGGYPEAHADALAANRPMRDAVAAFAASRRPIYAECGGLMYLARSIRTVDGRDHPMVGILPGLVRMHGALRALGYVEVEVTRDTILGPAGVRFRGHQFRYSDLLLDEEIERTYAVREPSGAPGFAEGYRRGSVLASYVHAHWASNPRAAEGFVAAASSGRIHGLA